MFNPRELTEEAWLAGTDPGELMEAATKLGWLSSRKLRLWACACCRRIWPLLVDECSRRAVEVAERFADGLASVEELAACRASITETPSGESPDHLPESAGWDEAANAAWAAAHDHLHLDQYELVHRTTTAVSLVAAAKDPWLSTHEPGDQIYRDRFEAFCEEVEAAEKLEQTRLVRDIVGNPFRPTAFDPRWRTEAVTAVSRELYDSRDFSAMPVLADALQDAGCEDEQVLGHCRGSGPHSRGCWVVDLVLDRR